MVSCKETMGEYLKRLRRAQAADKTWTDKRAERKKIRPVSISPAYTRGFDPKDKIGAASDVYSLIDPPAEALVERDRLAAHTPTLSQYWFGDPLPGRSALDKRRPHVVVDNG